MKASKKLFAVLAVLALAITVMPVISTPVAAAAVITSATGKWVVINGSYYFEVDYTAANVNLGTDTATLYTATSHSFVSVRAASSGSLLVPESDILNYYTIGVDSYLILDIAGATTAIPITMYNVTSNFGSSYVSGEPVGAVTGTVTAFNKTSTIVTSTASTPTLGLALVAVWEDEDGNTHSASVPNGVLTATVLSDGKTATFTIPSGAFRFDVPAGKVYVVSDRIYQNVGTNGTVSVNGQTLPVSGFAYQTINVVQGNLNVNPGTIYLPSFTKNIYVYDQFGYPVANSDIRVQFGYKDSGGNTPVDVIVTTDSNGSATITFPTPYAFGTYTATISTVTSVSSRVVDAYAVVSVSYGSTLALSDKISYPSSSTIVPLGPITISLDSTGPSIRKLWITVDDPNSVLDKSAAWDDFIGNYIWYELSPTTGFTLTRVYQNAGSCGVQLADSYWTATSNNINHVELVGTALQGGVFTVTVKAELSNGNVSTVSKQYVVKGYRIDSVTPNTNTYGTATTVKVVVKDAFGGYPDVNSVVVTLKANNEYSQSGPNQFVMVPDDFGNYTAVIPGAAVPGSYDIFINGIDYSTLWKQSWYYDPSPYVFNVGPMKDLNVSLSSTVNALSQFAVTVKDKNGNTVNGTWFVLNPDFDPVTHAADGSVVNGSFNVDTSSFYGSYSAIPLGQYTLYVTSSDGQHGAVVPFSVIAPVTITPTVVTNGLKSNIVVQMTASGMSAGQVKFRDAVRRIYQVKDDNLNPIFYDSIQLTSTNMTFTGQTATLTVTPLKQRECSNAVVRLLYGQYMLPSVSVAHPQLTFVNTATLYAGDTVPMQVKLTDALGNPVKGAVVGLSQLGYFNMTATTDENGVANFGNVTLNAAGNVVAELILNPDGNQVTDYRLLGQTVNTNYKVSQQVYPARPALDLKVTVTPTIVDAGKDALLTLNLVGADAKPVETGKSVVVTIGPTTYNGLVGANGVVTFTVRSESLTGTVVTGVVKVEGYNAATFTLAVKEAEKPEVKTLIELAPGMDVYTVNGETKFWDATPYIKNGRTLVPIRHLAEAIGFKASWDFSDPANKMVFIFKADQDPEKDKEHPFILLIIGQPTAMVNGNLVALDVAPEILNGRTMVPLRFVVETLGYQVEWLGNTIRLYK